MKLNYIKFDLLLKYIFFAILPFCLIGILFTCFQVLEVSFNNINYIGIKGSFILIIKDAIFVFLFAAIYYLIINLGVIIFNFISYIKLKYFLKENKEYEIEKNVQVFNLKNIYKYIIFSFIPISIVEMILVFFKIAPISVNNINYFGLKGVLYSIFILPIVPISLIIILFVLLNLGLYIEKKISFFKNCINFRKK